MTMKFDDNGNEYICMVADGPPQVKPPTWRGGEVRSFADVNREVDERCRAYQFDHDCDYETALSRVLEADEQLKIEYSAPAELPKE